MFAKRKIILVLFLFASFTLSAQDAISKYFEEYTEQENFTNVTISSKMFSLFTHIDLDSEEDKEMLAAMSKLKGLRILASDSLGDARAFYKKAIKKPGKDYEELMTIKNGGEEEMLFLIREENGKIAELVLMVGGNDGFFVMTIFGDVDLQQISKLSKSMNIEGIGYLGNLNKDELDEK